MQVIVVGGGIVGAATAYHLARDGLATTLVDAALTGPATSAGAGIVCTSLARPGPPTDPANYRLTSAGARYYPVLAARLAEDHPDLDLGYAPVGGLHVSTDEDELAQVYERSLARCAEAGEGEVTRVRRANELFPPLRGDLSGVHVSSGGRVDGRTARDTLLRAAQRHGALTLTGTVELTTRGSRVTGVEVDGEALPADAVVVAAGAWTSRLLAPLGLEVEVRPSKGQLCHVRLDGASTPTEAWPIVQTASGHYLLAFDGGRVVFGATREPDTWDTRVTPGGLAENTAHALAVAPGLADATYLETRVGLRPTTPDGRALLGPVEGTEGLIVATGLGAVGLTAGPWTGLLAASFARGEEPAEDCTAFRPCR